MTLVNTIEIFLCLTFYSKINLVSARCIPSVDLVGCNKANNDDQNFEWRTYTEHRIVLTMKLGCNSSTSNYIWTVETDDEEYQIPDFDNKPVFIASPFNLEVGKHILRVRFTETPADQSQAVQFSRKCYLKVVPTEPIALIIGGSRRVVPLSRDLHLNGTDSINIDCHQDTVGGCYLSYEWKCSGIKFCTGFTSKQGGFIIPKDELNSEGENKKITVTLITKSPDGPKSKPYIQTITITNEKTPTVYLICVKNCPPREVNFVKNTNTNYHLKCVSGCEGVVYKWMLCFNNDENSCKAFQTSTSVDFQIEDSFLGDSKSFFVVVQLGETKTELTRSDPMFYPSLEGNWNLNATEQSSLQPFNIFCACNHSEINGDLIYKVYEDDVLIASSTSRTVTGFFAAKEKPPKIHVTVHDLKTDAIYACGVEINVTISFVTSGNDVQNISEVIDQLYNGKLAQHPPLAELLSENRVQYAIQLINILVEQVRPLEDTEEGRNFRKNFGLRILRDLTEFSLVAPYEPTQLAGLLKNLMQVVSVEKTADRTITRPATSFLKNLALLNERELQNKQFPYEHQGEIVEMTQLLLGCFQENMFASNIPELEVPIMEITTPFPPITGEEPPLEDYPDYMLPNDVYMTKLRDYDETTKNIVDVTRAAGRALLQTLASSNRSYWTQFQKNSSTQVFKASGEIVANLFFNISVTDTSMRLDFSDDFKKRNDTIGFILTCFNHTNLMWWYRELKVQTGVMDLTVFDSNYKQIKKFALPNKISLKRYVTNKLDFMNNTINVFWTPESIDVTMNVTKVILNPGDGLMLHFNNLDDKTFIDVVGVVENRPIYEDFAKATVISKENPIFNLFIEERLTATTDVYVGILPNKKMLKGRFRKRRQAEEEDLKLEYQVAFETPKCVSWISDEKTWIGGNCKVGSTSTRDRIQCDCYEGTTFAGTFTKTFPINVSDTLLRIEIPLNDYFEANYLIFSNVFLLFFVYCWICLPWISKRNHDQREVIFLADNLIEDLYAYLIIVRTGRQRSSGTTSTVFLQLKGWKSNTHSHILNRPDPAHRLLQRCGEDWFVLATKRHLGELISLELWFDSNGCRASWYCENIEVYDLQAPGYWWFDVRRWFDVTKKEGVVKAILEPFEQVDGEKSLKKLNVLKKILKMPEPVHTWNLISGQADVSYLEQVVILFSIISTCYFFSMILYGIPTIRLFDNITYFGYFDLYPVIFLNAFCTSLLSFTLNFGILYLFRHSNSKLKKRLAWIFACTTIVTTQTISIVFGFWLTDVTSMLIISSVLLALIFNIFIIEYAYILIVRFIKLKNPRPEQNQTSNVNVRKVIKSAEKQRMILFQRFGPMLLRNHFLGYYQNLNKENIKKRQEKEEAKLKFLRLLQDIITFGLYLAVLCVVVLANKDSQIVNSNKEVKHMVVYAEHQHSIGLYDVDSTDNLIEYINTTIIPTVHATSWYYPYFVNDPGQMVDYNNKFLGIVRIRQHRMPNNSCPRTDLANQLHQTCVNEFFRSRYVYKQKFQEGWESEFFYENDYYRVKDFWIFRTSGLPVTGMYIRYPSGGYSAVLGRTVYNSYFNLDYLVSKGWFDMQTRLICLEFLIYNVNYNVFNSVKLIFEKTAGGYFDQTHNIKTTRLLVVKSQLQFVTIVFIVVFLILLVTIAIKKSYGLITSFRSYFKDIWNVIDLFIVAMSFICIVMFSYRIVLVGEFLDKLKYARRNEFIGFDHLFVIEDGLNIVAALLVCITTIRLWKLLRFARIFRKLERILIYSLLPLAVLFICQIIIIIGFGVSGYILFGRQSSYFKNAMASIVSLFYISLNLYQSFDYSILVKINGLLGNMYYIFFMLITFTNYTLYVTAIILGCDKSEEYFTKNQEGYTVWDFLSEELLYFWNSFNLSTNKKIFKGSKTKKDPVRCENCVQIPTRTMQAMKAVVKVILANGEADFEMMRDVAIKMHFLECEPDEEKQELFFVTNDEGDNHVLIDNRNLMKMEMITQRLLGKKECVAATPCVYRFEEMERIMCIIRELFKHIHVVREIKAIK